MSARGPRRTVGGNTVSAERDSAPDHRRLLRALFRRIADARGGDVVLVRCAWCDRIRVAPDEWIDADDAVVGHALLDRASHGICPACLARVNAPDS